MKEIHCKKFISKGSFLFFKDITASKDTFFLEEAEHLMLSVPAKMKR